MGTPWKGRRERIYHALARFAAEGIVHRDKTKLFKLLYLLDALHLERYGRDVTGLEYRAWAHGPVPIELWALWRNRAEGFADHFAVCTARSGQGMKSERLVPKFAFDPDLFSRSELELMDELAEKHSRDDVERMSAVSYFERDPWRDVWNGERGRGGTIPLDAATLVHRHDDLVRETLAIGRLHVELREQLCR